MPTDARVINKKLQQCRIPQIPAAGNDTQWTCPFESMATVLSVPPFSDAELSLATGSDMRSILIPIQSGLKSVVRFGNHRLLRLAPSMLQP